MNPRSPAEISTTLRGILDGCSPRIVACSGGVDSLLLSFLAHTFAPTHTFIVHGTSPAVPDGAVQRIEVIAAKEGWNFRAVRTGEIEDESYLSNPSNRCYFCKTHLYSTLSKLRIRDGAFAADGTGEQCTILSGANTDDLGEYRPGMEAAREFGVRHPFIEARVSKHEIRALCRHFNLSFAELPASPCLASRLYTGTRVTTRRLALVDKLEGLVRRMAAIEIVRGRVREREVLIELQNEDRPRLTPEIMEQVTSTVIAEFGDIVERVAIDPRPYRPGRAFVITQ